MSNEGRFEEKILYKTHQHWFILLINILKFVLIVALPIGIFAYLFSGFSWVWGWSFFFIASVIVAGYDHYLWHHSWLLIGNQKITLSVRNGIFSQYAMNIRYRNMRDSAVSKKSMIGYLLKFGTLFVRSSANEGDFQAHFVPKVGKVYAIVNALSRYTDEERAEIHSIEELYAFHQEKEFPTKEQDHSSMTIQEAIEALRMMTGVCDIVELSFDAKQYIRSHEEIRNSGVLETISRERVLVFLHNEHFRNATSPIAVKNAKNETYFPPVPFPEIQGNGVVSSSPGEKVHEYLLQFFPYHEKLDATILVGWDS